MKRKFNIFHPYSLAVIVALVSFGTLIYIGLTAPTPKEVTEVKGATTESDLYTKSPLKEYGTDLVINDQSAMFGNEFVDQQQVKFTAYSETSVTYDLFRITNKTDKEVTLKITPKKVTNVNMKHLTVNLLINGGTFEFYTYSETPNQDYFAITLKPHQSEDVKVSVLANELSTATTKGEMIFQIREM